jgi:hypothetical protein
MKRYYNSFVYWPAPVNFSAAPPGAGIDSETRIKNEEWE